MTCNKFGTEGSQPTHEGKHRDPWSGNIFVVKGVQQNDTDRITFDKCGTEESWSAHVGTHSDPWACNPLGGEEVKSEGWGPKVHIVGGQMPGKTRVTLKE